ncbi:hypothetical protein P5673_012290 [Acropora cervicornis]|uniref:Uncharacterized protein n=1 Tax=Acropora cervicornis TaxID=6130 RepID=A0AAD9QMW9_ACRCE|nr:hypothetical protein P5673_012290 [Acropora cervicornis]
MVPKAAKVRMEETDNSSITSFGRLSKKSSSKTTSSVSRERARAAAKEADLAKLKEKAQLEAKITAQKAEYEAGRREIEALLFKEDLDEFNV